MCYIIHLVIRLFKKLQSYAFVIMATGQHVILTGPPGVGKTTLVRKVIDELLKRGLSVSGFYTEEVRDPSVGKRTGFQVVTVDGQRGTLSSIQSKSSLKVGNYGVELEEFEAIAISALSSQGNKKIVIIDEIGKMELFSTKFKVSVDKVFAQSNIAVLATVPIAKGKPILFVEKIRNTPGAKLVTVDKNNRNHLLGLVLSTLLGESINQSV